MIRDAYNQYSSGMCAYGVAVAYGVVVDCQSVDLSPNTPIQAIATPISDVCCLNFSQGNTLVIISAVCW
jgi:hypothetical protein